MWGKGHADRNARRTINFARPNRRQVPVANGLVERLGLGEHVLHVLDSLHVPLRDVAVEIRGVVEHFLRAAPEASSRALRGV